MVCMTQVRIVTLTDFELAHSKTQACLAEFMRTRKSDVVPVAVVSTSVEISEPNVATEPDQRRSRYSDYLIGPPNLSVHANSTVEVMAKHDFESENTSEEDFETTSTSRESLGEKSSDEQSISGGLSFVVFGRG